MEVLSSSHLSDTWRLLRPPPALLSADLSITTLSGSCSHVPCIQTTEKKNTAHAGTQWTFYSREAIVRFQLALNVTLYNFVWGLLQKFKGDNWMFLLYAMFFFLFLTLFAVFSLLKLSGRVSWSSWPHPACSAKEQSECGQTVNGCGHLILISHWSQDAICIETSIFQLTPGGAEEAQTQRFGYILPSAAIIVFYSHFNCCFLFRFSKHEWYWENSRIEVDLYHLLHTYVKALQLSFNVHPSRKQDTLSFIIHQPHSWTFQGWQKNWTSLCCSMWQDAV